MDHFFFCLLPFNLQLKGHHDLHLAGVGRDRCVCAGWGEGQTTHRGELRLRFLSLANKVIPKHFSWKQKSERLKAAGPQCVAAQIGGSDCSAEQSPQPLSLAIAS